MLLRGLCVLAAVCSAAAAGVVVNTANGRFVDDLGRERIFHGSNVISKIYPFHPKTDAFDPFTSFSEEDILLFKKWGHNAVRLSVQWPGVEPVRGQYDEAFLDIYRGIVATAAKHGLSVVIEFHQDVFSDKFCGEGVPAWAVDDHKALLPFPAPLIVDRKKDICSQYHFSTFHATYAAAAAYQAFYSNTNGLADSFARYWGKLADTFKDFPNVIGYEIINEPFAGDVFRNPGLLVPGVADRKNIAPLHERVAAEIRKVDRERIIFFSGVTWDDFIPLGYSRVPGGPEFANRSAIAYHFYKSVNFDEQLQVTSRRSDAKRLGNCGMFMTEFSTDPAETIYKQLQVADKNLASWMSWEYKPAFLDADPANKRYGYFNQDGSLNTELVRAVSRTYAQAVAGSIQSMEFDAETSAFQLAYTAAGPGAAETEIYLNEELFYPSGFAVSVSPADAVRWYQPEPNRIHVVSSAAAKTLVRVAITATRALVDQQW